MNKLIVISIAFIYLIIFCIIVYYISLPYSNKPNKEKYIRDSEGNIDVYDDDNDKNDKIKKDEDDVFAKLDYKKLNKKTYKSKKLS